MSPSQHTRILELAGAPVTFISATVIAVESDPLLYEWRIYRSSKLTDLYVGLSRRGEDRPFRKYKQVVNDLRLNRGHCKVYQKPLKWYFPDDHWGYRWIHHQLEAAANRISSGNHKCERIELQFLNKSVPLQDLSKAEANAIAAARDEHGVAIVTNGWPNMSSMYTRCPHLLDRCWI